MPTLKYLLLLCFSLLAALLSAQPVAEVRTYGGPGFDEGREIIELEDGYVVVGSSSSSEANSSDIYVLRLNEDLSVNWARMLGGEASEQGRSACQTNNGDLLILGQTPNGPFGGYDIVIYRLNPQGEEVWVKRFGTDDWDLPVRIVKGINNYYIAATTYGFSPGGSRQWMFRIDEDGEMIDGNTYDVLPEATANDLTWYDGRLYLMGTRTYPGGSPQGILRQLTPSGATVWEMVRDSASFQGLSVDVSEYGVAAGFGYQDPNFDDSWDMYVIGTDHDGNEIFDEWSETGVPGDELIRGVTWIEDFIIYVAYTNSNFGAGGTGCFVVWNNILGSFIASTVFGGGEDEEPFQIIDDSQGRLLFVGHSESYGNGGKDLYLVRLPDYNISNNYQLDVLNYLSEDPITGRDEHMDFKPAPWPNPSRESVFLPGYTEAWELHNAQGNLVRSGSGREIPVRELPAGMYLLRWEHDGRALTDRILVQP